MADVKIKVKVDKEQAERDFKNFTGNLGKELANLKNPLAELSRGIAAAGKQSLEKKKHMAGLGQAMSQFNEKTEKGRQVLTAFGGALGESGGQVVYYAGTLSYMVGRFTLAEAAIMGGIAAFTMLGIGLYKLIHGPMDEFVKKTGEMITAFEEAQKSFGKLIDNMMIKLEGLTKFETQILKARRELHKIDIQRLEVMQKITELETSGSMPAIKQRFKLEDHLKKLNKLYDDQVEKMRELKTAQDLALPPLVGITPPDVSKAAKKAADVRGMGMIGWLLGMGTAEGIKQAIAFNASVIEAETEYQSNRLLKGLQDERLKTFDVYADAYIAKVDATGKKELASRIRIEDEITRQAEQAAKERERLQIETGKNVISIMGELGQVLFEGEENQKAARIAAIIAMAAYESAMEVAAGFKELGNMNPPAAAMHFTSAALYAAVAAGQVAAEARSETGKSKEERERRQGRGESPWMEEKRETTFIIQLGGREIGRAFHEEIEKYHDSRNPNRKHDRVGY